MKKYTTTERLLNTIARAHKDFGLKVDSANSLSEIFLAAYDLILEWTDYDYVSVGIFWDGRFLYWNDGMNYDLQISGEFVDKDYRKRRYFRKHDGKFEEIHYYDTTENDYTAMHKTIDSKGRTVLIVVNSSVLEK